MTDATAAVSPSRRRMIDDMNCRRPRGWSGSMTSPGATAPATAASLWISSAVRSSTCYPIASAIL